MSEIVPEIPVKRRRGRPKNKDRLAIKNMNKNQSSEKQINEASEERIEKILARKRYDFDIGNTSKNDNESNHAQEKSYLVKLADNSYNRCKILRENFFERRYDYKKMIERFLENKPFVVSNYDVSLLVPSEKDISAFWFEPEAILDESRRESGKYYLVKWYELSYSECTWEHEEFFRGRDELIRKFHSSKDRFCEKKIKTNLNFIDSKKVEVSTFIKNKFAFLNDHDILAARFLIEHFNEGEFCILKNNFFYGYLNSLLGYFSFVLEFFNNPILIIVPKDLISQILNFFSPYFNTVQYNYEYEPSNIHTNFIFNAQIEGKSSKIYVNFQILIMDYEFFFEKYRDTYRKDVDFSSVVVYEPNQYDEGGRNLLKVKSIHKVFIESFLDDDSIEKIKRMGKLESTNADANIFDQPINPESIFPLNEHVISVNMTELQLHIYKSYLERFSNEEFDSFFINVRQSIESTLITDPKPLTSDVICESSAKFSAILKLVKQFISNNEKTIIISSYRSSINVLEKLFTLNKIEFTIPDRKNLRPFIESFNKDRTKCLMIVDIIYVDRSILDANVSYYIISNTYWLCPHDIWNLSFLGENTNAKILRILLSDSFEDIVNSFFVVNCVQKKVTSERYDAMFDDQELLSFINYSQSHVSSKHVQTFKELIGSMKPTMKYFVDKYNSIDLSDVKDVASSHSEANRAPPKAKQFIKQYMFNDQKRVASITNIKEVYEDNNDTYVLRYSGIYYALFGKRSTQRVRPKYTCHMSDYYSEGSNIRIGSASKFITSECESRDISFLDNFRDIIDRPREIGSVYLEVLINHGLPVERGKMDLLKIRGKYRFDERILLKLYQDILFGTNEKDLQSIYKCIPMDKDHLRKIILIYDTIYFANLILTRQSNKDTFFKQRLFECIPEFLQKRRGLTNFSNDHIYFLINSVVSHGLNDSLQALLKEPSPFLRDIYFPNCDTPDIPQEDKERHLSDIILATDRLRAAYDVSKMIISVAQSSAYTNVLSFGNKVTKYNIVVDNVHYTIFLPCNYRFENGRLGQGVTFSTYIDQSKKKLKFMVDFKKEGKQYEDYDIFRLWDRVAFDMFGRICDDDALIWFGINRKDVVEFVEEFCLKNNLIT